MIDRSRNTFQYKGIDIIIESDVESVTGISFLIRDTTLPGNAYSAFAYLDKAKKFIDCNCKWERCLKDEN